MYRLTGELYDLLYGAKDFEREAQLVRRIVGERMPGAQSLLDVACGTGTHDRYLGRYFEVDGVDIDAGFLELARQKNARGWYCCADMRDFRMDRLYDVAVCLFSSIGYLQTLEEVEICLRRIGEHLTPEGILLVEPWFTPEAWRPGSIDVQRAQKDGVEICRMSHCDALGRISLNSCHYLIGTEQGIEHLQEVHEMGLFTVEEMKAAFVRADLRVEFDPEGLTGRGVYVGKKRD